LPAANPPQRAASDALASAQIGWRPGGLRLPVLSGVAVFLASQAAAATRRATRHESEAAPAVLLHRSALAGVLRRPVVIASVLGSMAAGVAVEHDGNTPVTPTQVLEKLGRVEQPAHYS